MIDVYRWDSTGGRLTRDSYQDVELGRPGEWLWVDVVDESPEAVRTLGSHFGFDESLIEEAHSTTNLPMIEEHTAEVFVVLHGLATGTGERLSTPEIDIFIGQHLLVTLRDGPRASVDELKERLADDITPQVGSPAGLLAHLALNSGRRHTHLIQELDRRIDGLEDMAIRGDPQTAVDVYALRRDVIYLRRALAPQFDVYEDLSESAHPAIDEDAKSQFVRVANQHRRSLEAIEASRSLLASVLETYRGAIADQTNEIMRVLTVFSAIMLPLGLVAGIWGTNFLLVPGATVEWGFWALVGAMALTGLGVWIYFARRGFIGAPRLRDLPKAVGLGIFTIGTAPIRVVTEGIRQLGRTDE